MPSTSVPVATNLHLQFSHTTIIHHTPTQHSADPFSRLQGAKKTFYENIIFLLILIMLLYRYEVQYCIGGYDIRWI